MDFETKGRLKNDFQTAFKFEMPLTLSLSSLSLIARQAQIVAADFGVFAAHDIGS